MKEHKLYNKLLDKISLEIELLVPSPFEKDKPVPVSILLISIPFIQSNYPIYSPLSSLSYKSLSFLPTLESKKPIVKIEENDNVNSDIEIQVLSPQ